MASSRWGPGMLLKTLQGMGQPLQQKLSSPNYQQCQC